MDEIVWQSNKARGPKQIGCAGKFKLFRLHGMSSQTTGKQNTPMSYLADHTTCRGKSFIPMPTPPPVPFESVDFLSGFDTEQNLGLTLWTAGLVELLQDCSCIVGTSSHSVCAVSIKPHCTILQSNFKYVDWSAEGVSPSSESIRNSRLHFFYLGAFIVNAAHYLDTLQVDW